MEGPADEPAACRSGKVLRGARRQVPGECHPCSVPADVSELVLEFLLDARHSGVVVDLQASHEHGVGVAINPQHRPVGSVDGQPPCAGDDVCVEVARTPPCHVERVLGRSRLLGTGTVGEPAGRDTFDEAHSIPLRGVRDRASEFQPAADFIPRDVRDFFPRSSVLLEGPDEPTSGFGNLQSEAMTVGVEVPGSRRRGTVGMQDGCQEGPREDDACGPNRGLAPTSPSARRARAMDGQRAQMPGHAVGFDSRTGDRHVPGGALGSSGGRQYAPVACTSDTHGVCEKHTRRLQRVCPRSPGGEVGRGAARRQRCRAPSTDIHLRTRAHVRAN